MVRLVRHRCVGHSNFLVHPGFGRIEIAFYIPDLRLGLDSNKVLTSGILLVTLIAGLLSAMTVISVIAFRPYHN